MSVWILTSQVHIRLWLVSVMVVALQDTKHAMQVYYHILIAQA